MKIIVFALIVLLPLSAVSADTLTVVPSANTPLSNPAVDSTASSIKHDTLAISKDTVKNDTSTNRLNTIANQKSDSSSIVEKKQCEIKGSVRDYYAKTPVAGANVNIKESSVTTQSKSDGTFSITPGSAGTCTLIISAPGYTPDTVTAQLSGDKVELPSIELKTNLQKMEKVVVVSKREGEVDALNKQKNSDNLKNVVSSELIEKLPDHTTADALQRVSGISLQRERGEGHYVQIRGTEPRLSTVTINGQNIAAPEGNTRAVALNVIPSDQLAEIEVSKVLIPEMDGDAIGGTVNLVTSGAKDKNLNVKLNLLPGYSQLSNKPLWQGSASAGKRFLEDGKLGVFLGGSYFREEKQTDGLNMHWDSSTYQTMIPDSNVNKAYGFLSNLQLRQTNDINDRIGLNGKLDYRFSPSSNGWLTASYNTYDQQEYRRGFSLAIDGDDARVSAVNKHVVNYVPVTINLQDRIRERNILSLTLGGNTMIAGSKIDANASYSNAQSKEPNRVDCSFSKTGQVKYSTNDPDNPQFIIFDLDAYRNSARRSKDTLFIHDTTFDDPTKWGVASGQLENKNVHENTYSGMLNVMVPVNVLSQTIETKMGIKGADHFKDQNVKYTNYISPDIKVPLVYPGLQYFLGDFSNDNFYNGGYKLGMMPDPQKVRSYFTSPDPTRMIPDTTVEANAPNAECYNAEDRNVAGYVQAKLKSNQWLFVGGLRLEYTSMHYSGFSDTLIITPYGYSVTKVVQMYRNFFFGLPMIVGKYSINDQINIRASLTRSFSRPDWYDLVPHQIKSYDYATGVSTVEKGNPDLKPTTSDNVDLSFEYYNSSTGLLSAGVFYKRMDDYVFSISDDTKPDGQKNPLTTFTKSNGDKADLAGAELNIQQQFTFLPSFLAGFGVNCNYTYTWSGTIVPGFNEESALPGQSEHVGNFALFYEKYGFSIRAALNYQSHFISEIGSYTTRSNDHRFMFTFVDDHPQLDASISQKIGKHFTAMMEFNNLTNTPYVIYLGDRDHVQQKEYYSWALQGGVRMNF